MNDRHDPNRTLDVPTSEPADSLDAGLAAGFGRPMAPRSSLGDLRPVLLKEVEGESAHIVKPKSDAMPSPKESGDRYRLDGEIARGGMGAVLRGRDVDLGRDLAVKVLLEKYANRPEVARRFIEEAQIGGQLQHPGVVPVYDIGRFGDRPFFTMKLVKGQTLAALLEERVSRKGAKDAKNEEESYAVFAPLRETLPRFLGIALKVSETLAYAHAKGVIHRDLKPANIMVGAFGEVQVMDWGLAKVLAEGGIADEERASRAHQEPEDVTTIRTARSTGSAGSFGTATEMGSLLGTPAYMPPEQANGDIANLDRRADVFGLGAILCEILTGKPPYVGRSSEEVRRKAANGDLKDAIELLDTCGADAELITLAKRCLSPEAVDRPKDAQEVTDGLSAYLNGVQERLQSAERERAVAVVREAEQRKKRKVQLALAAAVVGLMLGGGAFAFWRAEQAQAGRERDARNAEAVTALLNQCEEALRADDAAKAAVALEAARKRSAEGGAGEHAVRLGRLEADLALVRDLDAIDRFRWTWSEKRFPDWKVLVARTWEALGRVGTDPNTVSADEAAARVSASVVRERIVSALDWMLLPNRLVDVASLPAEQQKLYTPEWRAAVAALLPKTVAVRALLRRVDADPFRDAVRDAVMAEDRAKFVDLASQPAAQERPPGFVAFLGENWAIPVERRRQLLRAGVSRRSGNLSLLMALGDTYLADRKHGADEALRWYQAAIAVEPANFAAHINLCNALLRKGQVDAAIAYSRKAIELDPKHAYGYGTLGNALKDKGELDAAIDCYRKVIQLDPKNAIAHLNLGNALQLKSQLEAAVDSYRKAIELDPILAPAHNSLGALLCDRKKDYDAAIPCFLKAIEIDPSHTSAHHNLGVAWRGKGQVEKAIACFRKAIELDPKDANAHHNLGIALKVKGQLDEAIACLRKAIDIDPGNARAHNSLGWALKAKGEVDESIAFYRKAIELDPKDSLTHYNLGNALRAKGQLDESIVCYQKAIELDPKYANARTQLANVQRLAAVQDKVHLFLKGSYQPMINDERLALAEWCQIKKLHHAATGLYTAAFAADPKLADDLRVQHRYNAACFAALAAAGQGEDAAKLNDEERFRLRRQALDWLRADLAAYTKQLDSGVAPTRTLVQPRLRHWLQDTDLASLRDAAALAKLPADEQKAFTQLWTDVAALLKKAEMK